MKKLTAEQLKKLTSAAELSPRRRMNHNFHTDLTDPIQRLAIAMEPDTYIQPHRHGHTWELLTVLQGRFVVLLFNDVGRVIEREILGDDVYVIEIPAACWHAVLSLDDGGVILEVKHGPYAPIQLQDVAPWSPAPEDSDRQQLMDWYRDARLGHTWNDQTKDS